MMVTKKASGKGQWSVNTCVCVCAHMVLVVFPMKNDVLCILENCNHYYDYYYSNGYKVGNSCVRV